MDMIRNGNYPVEKHRVQTKDGYILTLHRIPRTTTKLNDRKVILLMHGTWLLIISIPLCQYFFICVRLKGISDSAQAFLNDYTQKPTAFRLFESGYDVWMINARGNVFSQRHAKLNSSDPQFWDFSWNEIGVFDIPATIDYILSLTNVTKLAYAGVSQGGSVILVTLSELPSYNDKISTAHLMAPVIILKHFNGPIPKSVDIMNLLSVSFVFLFITHLIMPDFN